LDFIETKNIPEGTFNLSGSWYKANDTSAAATHNLTDSIRFYATPNVQGITTQEELAAINTDTTTTLTNRYKYSLR
jgi:ABC-type uncharacterized transport system YnjBCD substrate-binding protein